MTTRTLPAAVLAADDPFAGSVARVVPPDAQLRKVGGAVVGYDHDPGAQRRASAGSAVPKEYSRLEMQGLHLRKILHVTARARLSYGSPVDGDVAWTAIVAEVAAAIVAPPLTAQKIENLCISIGFEPNPDELKRSAGKVIAAVRAGDFRMMSGALMGLLIKFTTPERRAACAALGLKRVAIVPFDDPTRRRRRDTGESHVSREAAAPWLALGMSRSTYYAEKHHLVDQFRAQPPKRAMSAKQSRSQESRAFRDGQSSPIATTTSPPPVMSENSPANRSER